MMTGHINNFPDAVAIRETQAEKLAGLLDYLQRHSPFYRRKFRETNLDVAAIKTPEDLVKIPVTGKEDLQAFNDDFLCVPRNKIIEFTSTSGTLGSPVTIALTEKDLLRLAVNEQGSFQCADGSAEDCYQLMLTLDRQFMAGMAYYSGIRRMGAGVIRVGPGVPSLQWETIFRLKPTAIVAVPSFILKLIGYAREHGIDISETSVTKAICIGENIRLPDFSNNVLSQRIQAAWNIKLYSTYASTEMQTAFTECGQGQGGHLQPDLLIVELLDDKNLPAAPGEPGEVTITTLGVEGMPLLRYKTGDICIGYHEPCACGRHSLRLSPVIGRKKQMIKFKGTTLFAPALYDLLNGLDDIRDFVAEVHSNEIGTDEVLLHLFVADPSEEADHRIRSNLQARLRVTPAIRYVSAEDLQKLQFPGDGRKPLRFLDRRTGTTGAHF